MNHLIWRLHRNQVYFAGVALALLTVLLLVTGITMADDYRTFLANCAATKSCASGAGQLFSGDGAIIDLVNFTLVVPLLFGLFWGAPLLAKELEDGTHNLAWTQAVTRRRWLTSKMAWALVAATGWGVAMTLLVSWWRFPENALDTRFSAFDVQGIVPVAYSLFAVALGIAAGSLYRRVLPAIATTLGVFVALRVAIAVYLRPHFVTPVTSLLPLSGRNSSTPPGAWIISNSIVGPRRDPFLKSVSLRDVPAACRKGFFSTKDSGLSCLSSHGFHLSVVYQPDSRFWIFQGIEAALFVVLAAGLVVFAYRSVLSRDA
jgi:hypothetical protein